MAYGEIVSITIVTQQGAKSYNVGMPIDGYCLNGVNGRVVGKIEDCSAEFPDSITIIYRVYDTDGDWIASVENCPVDVMYAKPKEQAAGQ